MSLLRLAAMLVAVSAIAISCKSTPTSTPTPGPSPSTAIGACSPRNIANTPSQTAARSMDISWTNPSLGCAGSYNIVAIASNGTPKQTVKQVPSEASSAVVGGLNLCTFYRYGVQAVSPDGRKGAVVRPGHFVYESGLPNAVPPIVTIVLQGIGSSNERGDFDPAKVSYCTSPNGKEPPVNAQPALQGLDSSWLNYDVQSDGTVKTDQSTAGPGAGNNLIDSLASTGGYVLPFSYTGSTVTGTAANPMFHSPAFTSNNVAVSSIGGEQDLLETEIANVRKVWHNTKIVVIGHSNGGLIAEQWWLNHRSNLHGVTQVFSLDAPLNGVYDASKCLIGECVFGGVGQSLSESYDNLWIKQAKNDPYWVRQDNQDKVFTAVGTYGDPLYDAGDNTVTAAQPTILARP